MKSYKQLRSNSDVCPECKEDPCVCDKVHESSEPVELDEVSKELANRYMYSAFSDRKRTDDKITALQNKQDTGDKFFRSHKKISKLLAKSDKRTTGIGRALARLTKEEAVVEGKMGEKAAGDLDFHAEPHTWVPTGKTATHTSGVKTFEYAKVDKEGKRTGDRHYRTAQGKVMGEEYMNSIIVEKYSEDDIAKGGTVIYKHEGKHYMSKVSHKTGGGAGTKIHTTSALGHVVPLHNVVSTDASDWNTYKNRTVKEEKEMQEANEYHKLAVKHLKDMMAKDTTPNGKEYARKMNKRALEAAKMSDPVAAKKHYMGVSEEAEQIDELNVMTLSKYAAKARSQSMDKDNPKRYKRGSGAAKAYDKIHRGEYSEGVEHILEYDSDLAKMKKSDSYKVGDKVWTKVGGAWHRGHITTPLNKAGNHGVTFQHKGMTHKTVSNPHSELRLNVEEVDLGEAVTVDKKNYSWGKMVTVHHGSNTSFPLHPEHQAAIKKLRPGMKTTFKDETGRQVHAHREGDQVHLTYHNTGSSTATKATVGYHHFDEGYVPDRSGQLTKSDASAMSKVAALMAKERQKKAAQQTDTKAVKAVKQMHSNPMSEDAMSGQLDDTNSVKETSAPVKGSFVEIKPKTSKSFKSIRSMQKEAFDPEVHKAKAAEISARHKAAHAAVMDTYKIKDKQEHRAANTAATEKLNKIKQEYAAHMAKKPIVGSDIAQDYKDQEKRRGIGHVRD